MIDHVQDEFNIEFETQLSPDAEIKGETYLYAVCLDEYRKLRIQANLLRQATDTEPVELETARLATVSAACEIFEISGEITDFLRLENLVEEIVNQDDEDNIEAIEATPDVVVPLARAAVTMRSVADRPMGNEVVRTVDKIVSDIEKDLARLNNTYPKYRANGLEQDWQDKVLADLEKLTFVSAMYSETDSLEKARRLLKTTDTYLGSPETADPKRFIPVAEFASDVDKSRYKVLFERSDMAGARLVAHGIDSLRQLEARPDAETLREVNLIIRRGINGTYDPDLKRRLSYMVARSDYPTNSSLVAEKLIEAARTHVNEAKEASSQLERLQDWFDATQEWSKFGEIAAKCVDQEFSSDIAIQADKLWSLIAQNHEFVLSGSDQDLLSLADQLEILAERFEVPEWYEAWQYAESERIVHRKREEAVQEIAPAEQPTGLKALTSRLKPRHFVPRPLDILETGLHSSKILEPATYKALLLNERINVLNEIASRHQDNGITEHLNDELETTKKQFNLARFYLGEAFNAMTDISRDVKPTDKLEYRSAFGHLSKSREDVFREYALVNAEAAKRLVRNGDLGTAAEFYQTSRDSYGLKEDLEFWLSVVNRYQTDGVDEIALNLIDTHIKGRLAVLLEADELSRAEVYDIFRRLNLAVTS